MGLLACIEGHSRVVECNGAISLGGDLCTSGVPGLLFFMSDLVWFGFSNQRRSLDVINIVPFFLCQSNQKVGLNLDETKPQRSFKTMFLSPKSLAQIGSKGE